MTLTDRDNRAFTLLEVLIAMFIFFMAIFAILDLVAQNLRSARRIQPDSIDASSLAAELMLTNRLEEGSVTGDFGEMYPGYSWARDIYLVSTNGLFQVDFTVFRSGPSEESKMSIFLYRPESKIRPGEGVGRGFQMR
jgi:Tfp pilus assembly protein PilV